MPSFIERTQEEGKDVIKIPSDFGFAVMAFRTPTTSEAIDNIIMVCDAQTKLPKVTQTDKKAALLIGSNLVVFLVNLLTSRLGLVDKEVFEMAMKLRCGEIKPQ